MRFANSLLLSAPKCLGVSAVGTEGVQAFAGRDLKGFLRAVALRWSGCYTGAAPGEFGVSSAGTALVLADWLWIWLFWCMFLPGEQGLSGDSAAIPSRTHLSPCLKQDKQELLQNVFPVSRAHRKLGAFIFSFHGCPCETGTLHPGKSSFPLEKIFLSPG